MSVTTGVVQRKSGQGTGIVLEGSTDWYNVARAKTYVFDKVNVGDSVTLKFNESNGKRWVDSADVDTSAAPAPQAAGKPAATGDRANVQEGIVYQSSRKDAIQVACTLLETGVLPFPSQSKDKKHDAFMSYVDLLTDRYFKEACSVQATGELPTRETGEE